MKKLLMIIPMVALLASCGVNPHEARRILEEQGMTDVKIGGYSLFGCSKGDNFSSSFTATSVKGNRVRGVICGGVFKGYTVRFN